MMLNNLIKHITSILRVFINAGFTESEHGLFLVSKVRIYNIVASIAVLVSFILGLFAFAQNFLMLSIADIFFAFIALLEHIYKIIGIKNEKS